MSADLQWLLLRKNNSFMVKKVREGPVFSKEPGNLLNLHSFKYSGLANSKTIHVQDSPSGLQISSRKPKASPHSVKPSNSSSSVRRNAGSRRALGISTQFAKRGYRPDLRSALLARVSALQATRREPKPLPERKVRGKKAVAKA